MVLRGPTCIVVVLLTHAPPPPPSRPSHFLHHAPQTLFSAGERQLLAVARALLLHAPVSLFDECTSSVDERTDEMVHDAVLALPSTVLSICHRLAHLPRFDLVLVLADGRVAEYGRVADLMADQGSLTSSMYTRYRDLGA